MSGAVQLKHHDRVLLGNNFFFRFVHPKQAEGKEGKGSEAPDWFVSALS